ncbi:MAG: L-aspartate oxidase [Lachnospiraceae bacterium]|nr:L-aspartate oxidase [Lachnospiraceae bacterium]
MNEYYDAIIVGTGAAGLYCALNLPKRKKILMLTKQGADLSDSFLAQGGICMLRGEDDYEDYFEDTMRAGHYENNKRAVNLMIRSSNDIIRDLLWRNVDFVRAEDGELAFTREGAHSRPRILFHEDITGKEITQTLLDQVKTKENIEICEYMTMVDIISKDNICGGVIAMDAKNNVYPIRSQFVVLACGGIGGLFQNSTNYPHIAGDGLGIAMKHQVKLEHLDYIQIHPTTLFSHKPGRRFLVSESVRGEGALLYDKNGQRFTNELQPRDLLSQAIFEQMEKDGTDFVWEDMRPLGEKTIMQHFPNIYQHCIEEGFDPRKEPIPVVPAQHYFMGGIQADLSSRTSMRGLYACGETSCNGVHGKNRLASNSLLESLVFARRAADDMIFGETPEMCRPDRLDLNQYEDQNVILEGYHKQVLNEIERMKKANE